jgi:predicted ribosomally synthesized peptide with nif11-like leader
MDFKDLSPELREKARKCKTPQEILNLARDEGYELSEDDLNAISGGVDWTLWCSDQSCYQVCSADYA